MVPSSSLLFSLPPSLLPLPPRGRYVVWQFNLYAILIMLILVLPLYVSFQTVTLIRICERHHTNEVACHHIRY